MKRNLSILSANGDGEQQKLNISNANPAATAQNIDTFARALNALTVNTYSDTLIIETSSVNEILAE